MQYQVPCFGIFNDVSIETSDESLNKIDEKNIPECDRSGYTMLNTQTHTSINQ